MQKEDSGVYECIIRTEYGEGSETFEIKMNDDDDKNESTESNKPTITPFNLNHKKHSIKFNFIELSLRPTGRVVVLCESGKLSSKKCLNKYRTV